MRVVMQRILKMADYETQTYLVEVTESDIPALDGEGPNQHENRMHEFTYKKVLAYQVLHNVLTKGQAIQELKRYKVFYGMNSGKAQPRL